MRFVLASGNRHKLGEFRAILAPHAVVAMPGGIALPPEGTESFAANARVKARALAEAVVGDRALVAALRADPAWGGADVVAAAQNSGAAAADPAAADPAAADPAAVDPAAATGPDAAAGPGAAGVSDIGGARGAGLEDVLFFADDSGLEVEALGWAPGVTSARYAGVDGPGADRANYERLLGELAAAGLAGAGPLARFVCTVVAVTPRMKEYAATGYWWGAITEAPRGEGGFGYDPVFVPEGSDLTVAEWPQEKKDQASHRALAGKALLERLRREGLVDGSDGAAT